MSLDLNIVTGSAALKRSNQILSADFAQGLKVVRNAALQLRIFATTGVRYAFRL